MGRLGDVRPKGFRNRRTGCTVAFGGPSVRVPDFSLRAGDPARGGGSVSSGRWRVPPSMLTKSLVESLQTVLTSHAANIRRSLDQLELDDPFVRRAYHDRIDQLNAMREELERMPAGDPTIPRTVEGSRLATGGRGPERPSPKLT
jgi:hypothetical protein